LVAYLLTKNLLVAVALSMAVGIAQLAVLNLKRRRIDIMHWISLVLVLALGAATFFTQDSRFVMAKPSIIHFAIGAVMLRRGWMVRYLPPIVTDNVPEQVLIANGYAWAALMFGLGLLNLFVALHYSITVWAWFISFGAIGAKVAAFLLQYLMFRTLIRRKLRAAAL
jgi:intracellular septation protein A